MKKKILFFLSVVGLCLFGLFNSLVVSAQDEYPDNLIALQFLRVVSSQTHEKTYEYLLEYTLPYQVVGDIEDSYYFFVHKHSASYGFLKGEIDIEINSYKLEDVILISGETRFRFRMTVTKTLANRLYPERLMPFFTDDSVMYLKFDNTDYMKAVLREYFYRIPPKERPENLYQVGMPTESGSAYAGRLYWTVQNDFDISNYIQDFYNMFISYTSVPGAYLQSFTFFDKDRKEVAYVQMTDELEHHVFKFDNEERYVVGMLHFKDISGEYVDWSKVKYMKFTYHTEPYPDSSVLINLANTLDISIGEYWRTAEAFNNYYQAGYEEGFHIGYGRGQELINDEILEMLEKEYQRGYNAGVNDNFNVFSYLQALFGEQGLGRLLRLELLPGVSLGAVIMIPLAFWLVSFIMRWFR